MIPSLLLVLSFGVSGQTARTPSHLPTPELSVLVERVVRLADLQRRKLDVEQELASLRLGSEHPVTVNLRTELADLTRAIGRENLQAHENDANLLAERRLKLETELSRLRVGPQHPERRQLYTKLAAVQEQQRVAAVAFLASGGEADLRAMIARQPDYAQTYLELANLYITADRADEAGALITQAQAALKRSGGR